jgi:uncharacterized cupredoxin-like copper-binding protein
MRIGPLQIRIAALLVAFAIGGSALGHEATAFGEAGDASKPSRAVHVTMREAGTKMLFAPDTIQVKKGEQIRFVVDNDGIFNHEFVLGTERSITTHAVEMKEHPDMQHDDAHSLSVAPYAREELLWHFTKPGRFVFACLIPGHLERGMKGTIVVR